MGTTSSDIRKELEERMNAVQQEIGTLKEKRDEIDRKITDTEAKLGALRVVYQIEAERIGEPRAPLFVKGGTSYRFAGMKLTQALDVIRTENPTINKRQALKILEKENFDFRAKRRLNAVHFAWIALDNRKKRKK